MRILGMVGGIGPESTIAYYRALLLCYRRLTGRLDGLPLIINSIDLGRLFRLTASGDTGGLAEYLLREIERLADAGAQLGFVAANTPHIVFDELQARSPIPLVSIVSAARDTALALGLSRLGVLGTRFTMESAIYPRVFREAGMTALPPDPEERSTIHLIYTDELLCGRFDQKAREQVLRIVRAMVARDRIDGVILAGTELPLLFQGHKEYPVPFLDTLEIHVNAIMDELVSSGRPRSTA